MEEMFILNDFSRDSFFFQKKKIFLERGKILGTPNVNLKLLVLLPKLYSLQFIIQI